MTFEAHVLLLFIAFVGERPEAIRNRCGSAEHMRCQRDRVASKARERVESERVTGGSGREDE